MRDQQLTPKTYLSTAAALAPRARVLPPISGYAPHPEDWPWLIVGLIVILGMAVLLLH
jgi:hypothetical protein